MLFEFDYIDAYHFEIFFSGLNLNMSASEMRAYLASRKKADPRKETMDLKKKYEIIQNM